MAVLTFILFESYRLMDFASPKIVFSSHLPFHASGVILQQGPTHPSFLALVDFAGGRRRSCHSSSFDRPTVVESIRLESSMVRVVETVKLSMSLTPF